MDIFERILKASELYDDNRPGLNDGGMLVKPSADGSRPGYKEDIYTTRGGTTLSTKKNVKEGFIYPVKNKKGNVRWRKTLVGKERLRKYDFTKKAPIPEMENNKRFKFDIDKNAWVYLSRDKDNPVIVKKKDETFKQFVERKEDQRLSKMKKSRDVKISNIVDTKNKIDNWTKNWLDNNLDKYTIKQKNKFINDLKKDYKKFVNKEIKTDKVSGTSVYSKDKLPNISRSVSEQLSPFEYEGFKTVNVGKLGGDLKKNPTKLANNEPYLRKIFFKNRVENIPGFKEDLSDYFNYITTNKRTAIGREATKNFVPNKDVVYFLDSNKSGVNDTIKGDIMSSLGKDLKNQYDAYQYRVRAGLNWVKNAEIIEKTLGEKEMIRLTGFPKIKQGMNNEAKQLKKIFDFTELPEDLKLSYALDHGQGIAGAARSGDKNLMRLAVTDLIGSTVKTNEYLGRGTKGEPVSFERKRNMLIDKIRKGEDVATNLEDLNNLVEKTYGKKDVYKFEKGKLISSPISSASTPKERFAQYFEEINKTKEGKDIIKQKYGGLKNLISSLENSDQIRLARIGCAGKATGGRIGYFEGQNLTYCATKGAEKIKNDPLNLTPGDQQNLRALGKSAKAVKFLKGFLGPAAIAGELIFEGGFAANKFMDKGIPIKQALGESYINKYLLGPKLQIDVEAERAKEFAKGQDFAMAERGRRMMIPQSVAADERRLKQRQAEMNEMYPNMIYANPTNEVIDRMLEEKGVYSPYTLGFGMQQKQPGIGDMRYNEQLAYDEIRDYINSQVDKAMQENKMSNLAYGAANFAGGGIAGLSGGAKSGPAPESGKTPHGLLSLKNNVKNY